MKTKPMHLVMCSALVICTLLSCDSPSEAVRVELPLVVDASSIVPVTNDLGYEVTLTSVRIALKDPVFTIAGEVHTASPGQRILDLLVPNVYAHPGHYQGGEVTGELSGEFVIDWIEDEGQSLGTATLIAGEYTAANFTFIQGGDETVVAGHTAILEGSATKDGTTTTFTITLDSPEGRQLVGAPFTEEIKEDSTGSLHFIFSPLDELEGDTLFDSIDFESLDEDGDHMLSIEPDQEEVEDAYNVLRRKFQTHDHYTIQHID